MRPCPLSTVIYLWSLLFVYSSDICIWQASDETVTHINGLYTYNSDSTGYYEKQDTNCNENTMFLFNAQNTWYISSTFADTTDYIAYCNAHTAPESPSGCGGYWEFPDLANNPSLQVTEGECPVLSDCGIIEVLYWSNTHCRESPDDCCGEFGRYTDLGINNVYYKQTIDGNRYLYFSETNFRWICSTDESDITTRGKCLDLTSDTVEAYALDPAWHGMQAQMVRKYSWSSNKNKTSYLRCESADMIISTQAVLVTETTDDNIAYHAPWWIAYCSIFISILALE